MAKIKKPKMCVTKLMHQLNARINALVNIYWEKSIVGKKLTVRREIYDSDTAMLNVVL